LATDRIRAPIDIGAASSGAASDEGSVMTARHIALCSALLGVGGSPAAAADNAEAATASATVPAPTYQLVESPWLRGFATAGPRAERSAGLGRHELRLSSETVLRVSPQIAFMSGLGIGAMAPSYGLDAYRATYRYTIYDRSDWAFKVGVSTQVRDGAPSFERTAIGGLPLMHVAGRGRLGDKWRLAFNADGMLTARGHAYDLGVRVDYSLSPRMSVFGGYRLSDIGNEYDEATVNGVNNAARVGLQWRF
jgi:hypothetical protein